MLMHRPESKLVRLSLVAAILCLLALSAVGCGGSTDSELKSAVQQLDQDLQQSVGQLNQGITDSLTELNTAVSSAAQAAPAPQKWEYKLDSFAYDLECATSAVAPYKDSSEVKDIQENYGLDWTTMGVLHFRAECTGDFPARDWLAISASYVQCGREALQAYTTKMGEEGWELVSYSPLENTWPGSQYCSALTVGAGYEVMWKRPKTAE